MLLFLELADLWKQQTKLLCGLVYILQLALEFYISHFIHGDLGQILVCCRLHGNTSVRA